MSKFKEKKGAKHKPDLTWNGKRRWILNCRCFFAHFLWNQRTWAKNNTERSQKWENWAPRWPKWSQRTPKVSQLEPKGRPKGPRESQKGSQREPRGAQREPKGSQRTTKMHQKIDLRPRSRKWWKKGARSYNSLEVLNTQIDQKSM